MYLRDLQLTMTLHDFAQYRQARKIWEPIEIRLHRKIPRRFLFGGVRKVVVRTGPGPMERPYHVLDNMGVLHFPAFDMAAFLQLAERAQKLRTTAVLREAFADLAERYGVAVPWLVDELAAIDLELGVGRCPAPSRGMTSMQRVLFVCGKNRWRSPTAEQIFATWPDLEVASAGVDGDADNPVSAELLEWADTIFVMEKQHRAKLAQKYRAHLKRQRIICLDIADDYPLMDPTLIEILKSRVPRHLRSAPSGESKIP